MRYLAYTKATQPTGRVLAELLGFSNFGVRGMREPLHVLLRWGSRRKMPQARLVLNQARAIQLAGDKLLAIEAMASAGIPTVPFFRTWGEAQAAARGDGVIFGRTRSGMRGQGITIYTPGRQPRAPHEWYSLYQEPTREIRVHVVDREVIRVQGKFLDLPELAGKNPYVRNHEGGYRYRTPKMKVRRQRQELAIEAVRTLGLTFGAVDMLLFGSETDPMVLEVNTAPACNPLTAQKYAEALARIIP